METAQITEARKNLQIAIDAFYQACSEKKDADVIGISIQNVQNQEKALNDILAVQAHFRGCGKMAIGSFGDFVCGSPDGRRGTILCIGCRTGK